MRRLFLTILLTAAISMAYSADYVDVTGRSECKVTPNRGEIVINLTEADYKGRFTLSELESKTITALKSIGVDIDTQLTAVSQSISKGKRQGVDAFKVYALEVRTAQDVSDVMAALESESINTASLTRVWVEGVESISDSLKVAAIKSARYNAALLANAVEQSIGAAQTISYTPPYNGGGVVMRSAANSVMDAGMLDANSYNIQFQDVKLQESVTVKFQLLDTK